MGMFDEIKCEYPLPVKGANKLVFKTKSTPAQYIDLYEIRKDGTLWHETYDVEDRSDPKAKGILRMAGCMTRINQRWEQVNMTGEIRFYTFTGKKRDQLLEFSAYFVDGKLNQIHKIQGDKHGRKSNTKNV